MKVQITGDADSVRFLLDGVDVTDSVVDWHAEQTGSDPVIAKVTLLADMDLDLANTLAGQALLQRAGHLAR